MIDKPLYIIIFMYCASTSFLGAQFLADSYGITLVNPDGVEVKSAIIDYINVVALNEASNEIIGNQTSARENEFINNPILAGATIAWEMFLLLTGVYVFNLPFLFGVPVIFLVPIGIGYMILLGNTLLVKIRGV